MFKAAVAVTLELHDSESPDFGSEKNTERKKHVNIIFTGLSRDLGGGTLFMCFFSPIRNDPRKKNT